MTRHDPGVTLRQMRDFAEDLPEIIEGKTREDLDSVKPLPWALLQGLQILGEAATRLPREVHARYPELPWRQMIGMRNRLIHGYDDVNLDYCLAGRE